MQNVTSATIKFVLNSPGLGKLVALNIFTFVENMLLSLFCALFSAILWVNKEFFFFKINDVIGLKMGYCWNYQRGNGAVMLLNIYSVYFVANLINA